MFSEDYGLVFMLGGAGATCALDKGAVLTVDPVLQLMVVQ